jgi:renierapurpurin 18,18'-hydroxylase
MPTEFRDLRRVGANPDYWYLIVLSGHARNSQVIGTAFPGERITLYRGASETVHRREDRCAHRQVPLSTGVAEG